MKQITIYEFLETTKGIIENGYVAFDGVWYWYGDEPEWVDGGWENQCRCCLLGCFNIAPFDGDWKDSLIKVEYKEEE